MNRAELHARGDKSTSHARPSRSTTRATGITWRAVRGDDQLKNESAAGHKRFSTTEGYIREAEPLREGFGAVFPTLPKPLFDPKEIASSKILQITVPKEGLEPSHPYG